MTIDKLIEKLEALEGVDGINGDVMLSRCTPIIRQHFAEQDKGLVEHVAKAIFESRWPFCFKNAASNSLRADYDQAFKDAEEAIAAMNTYAGDAADRKAVERAGVGEPEPPVSPPSSLAPECQYCKMGAPHLCRCAAPDITQIEPGLKATSDNDQHYQCKICGGNPTAFPYKPDPKLHSPAIGGKVGRCVPDTTLSEQEAVEIMTRIHGTAHNAEMRWAEYFRALQSAGITLTRKG